MQVEIPGMPTLEFPDSMTEEQVKEVVRRKFGPQSQQPEQPTQPAEPLSELQQVYQSLGQQLDTGEYNPESGFFANNYETGQPNSPQQRLASLYQKSKQDEPNQSKDWMNYVGERLPFAGAGVGVVNTVTVRKAAERYNAGNPTPEDLVVLKNYIREQEFEQGKSYAESGLKGVARQGFDLATRLPGMFTEFAATGPVGAAAGKLVAGANAANKVRQVGGFVANAAARAAANPLRVAESAEGKRLTRADMKDVGKAYVAGFGDMLIENATEMMGIPIAKSKVPELMHKAAAKVWTQSTGRPLRDFTRQASRWGYNGIIGEMIEERAGEIARGATGVEEDYGATGDLAAGRYAQAAEQLAVEFLGFMAPAGIKAGAEAAGRQQSGPKPKMSSPLNRADVTPAEIVGDEQIGSKLIDALAKSGADPAKFPRRQFERITGVTSHKVGKTHRQLMNDTFDMLLATEEEAVAAQEPPPEVVEETIQPEEQPVQAAVDPAESAAPASEPAAPPAEAPPVAETVEPEPVMPAAKRSIKDITKAVQDRGYDVKVVEPKSEVQKEVQEFASQFGVELQYVQVGKSKGPGYLKGMGGVDGGMVLLNEQTANNTDVLWRVAGHELAHATGIDQLHKDFDQETVSKYAKQYYSRTSMKRREELDARPEELFREGVAEMVGEFMTSQAMRNKVKKSNPTLFGKILDYLRNVLSNKTLPGKETARIVHALNNQLKKSGKKPLPIKKPAPAQHKSMGAAAAWGTGVDKDAPTEREEWTQRYEDRGNFGTTVGGRRETYLTAQEMGRVETRSRAVAVKAAEERIKKDAPGEIKKFLDLFSKTDAPQLSEEDTMVVRLLGDEVSIATMLGSREALEDLRILVRGYHQGRTEQSRALGLRDPVVTAEKRRVRAVKESLLSLDNESLDKVMIVLKENGITMDDIDLLAADPSWALKIIRVVRDHQPSGWPEAVYEYWQNAILSGPLTHATNIASNTANMLWTFGPERVVEALLNTAIGRKHGAQLGEFKWLWRGITPGWQMALQNARETWINEESSFNRMLGREGQEKFEGPRAAIKGAKGRAIRMGGYRPLTAADDFSKSLVAVMDVGVQGYRIATQEGLTGEARSDRVMELVRDMDSIAWTRAVSTAYEMAFQQEGGVVAQTAKKGLKVFKTGAANPIKYIFPFTDTSINIFAEAVEKMPMIGLMGPVMRELHSQSIDRANLRKGMSPEKVAKLREARPQVNWSQAAAKQVISMVALMALMDKVEGDEDDDDKMILITGSSKPKYNERMLQYRTGMPMGIRLGGKDGIWLSYSRIEPFATALGAAVDAVAAFKRGDNAAAAAAESVLHQSNDKTFLKNMAELSQLGDRNSATISNIAKNVGTGFVPNLYRQSWYAFDDRYMENRIKKTDPPGDKARKWLQEARVLAHYVHKKDLWGRDVHKYAPGFHPTTSFVYRLTVPVQTRDATSLPVDVALLRWNEAHPDETYAPSMPAARYGKGNKNVMLMEQYEAFLEQSGKMALDRVSKIKFSNPPTKSQIEMVKKHLSTARRVTKRKMFPNEPVAD